MMVVDVDAALAANDRLFSRTLVVTRFHAW
jgi:hypothetical protein